MCEDLCDGMGEDMCDGMGEGMGGKTPGAVRLGVLHPAAKLFCGTNSLGFCMRVDTVIVPGK